MTRRRPIQAGIQTGADDKDGDEAAKTAGISADQLREAYAHWASGVTLLAARDGSSLEAITVTAFTPLSVEPPLVCVCLHEQAAVLPIVLETRRFTVSVLSEDQRRTANIAADRVLVRTLPFAVEGDPLLADALVSFVCRLGEEYPGGDHRVLVGEVERVVLGPDEDPLLYYRRAYGAWTEK
jgi:flavin reductase (DIM6/NTAB) family NADH-FMN oxidoreductase RutF